MFTFLPPDGITAFTAPLDCKRKSSDDYHIQILDIIHNNYGMNMILRQLVGVVTVGTFLQQNIRQEIKSTLLSGLPQYIYTHTHTHTYMYIYVYVCVCVCVCMCVCVCVCTYIQGLDKK